MPLEMKQYCEGCGKRLLKNSEEVFICSFESSYCEECARLHKFKCPVCEGKLEKRPARIISEIKVLPIDNVEGIIFFNDIKNNFRHTLKFDNSNSTFLITEVESE